MLATADLAPSCFTMRLPGALSRVRPLHALLAAANRGVNAADRSGGVQGGISNGENILLRVAFKPTATISRNQKTVGRDGHDMELRARGRHDPCVVPRAVPMVEAMVALVLADHLLQHFAQCELLPRTGSVSPDTSIATQFRRNESQLSASH